MLELLSLCRHNIPRPSVIVRLSGHQKGFFENDDGWVYVWKLVGIVQLDDSHFGDPTIRLATFAGVFS